MSAFNILRPNHFMMGIDFHDALIPPEPKPIPFIPHSVFAPLEGYVNAASVRKAEKTNAEFVPMLKRGTDIGIMIPHIGLNALLPLVILGSGSKSYFGAGTVKLEKMATAVAVCHDLNINLNCGGGTTPPTPTGFVMAPSTVRCGMTMGDLYAGIAQMVVEAGITWGINVALGKAGDALGLGPVAGGIAGLLAGWVIGTPLGYAFGGGGIAGGLGAYDWIEGKANKMADYYNHPSRREYR